jgi:hypothetical protein
VSSQSTGQLSGEGGCQPRGRDALRGTVVSRPDDGTALCSGGIVEQRSDRGSVHTRRRRQVKFFLDEEPMPGIRTTNGTTHVGETVGGIGPWPVWSGPRCGRDRCGHACVMLIGAWLSGPRAGLKPVVGYIISGGSGPG